MKVNLKTRRLVLIALLLGGMSASGWAQDVSLNFKEKKLETVLSAIKSQTGYSLAYSDEYVNVNQKVSIEVKNKPVKMVLNDLLKNLNISYEVRNNTIYLTKKEGVRQSAQKKKLTGVVKDETGETIIGANVSEKNNPVAGTITNLDGEFTLENVPVGSEILISYVGFKPVTVKFTGAAMNVTLHEDSKVLNEVVVTALGIKKEAKSLSYNVQQLPANEMTKLSDANFVNSLSGKVAGVTINSSSTGVGGATRIVMRGAKSINGNNNALYVIDGIPMMNNSSEQANDVFGGAGQTGDAISNINPDDIESISVLSGPSAAALYGSSAANGVVMVTTKKGRVGKVQVSLSNSTSFSNPLKMPEFQNTYGQTETGSYQSWGDKLATPSSYDPKDFFQTGVNVTNSVSLSAGTERNQTYLSLGNVNAEGIVNNNNYDRYNFSVKNTTDLIEKKLILDLNLGGNFIKEQNMLAQGQYFNPLTSVYLFPAGDDFSKTQLYERYDSERNFKTQYWPYGDQGLSMQNPYWVTDRNMFINNKDRYMASMQLKYNVNDWLSLSGRAKMDETTSRNQRKYYASTNTLFASDYGYYLSQHIKERQIYGEFLVNINKYFNNNTYNLVANIGTSINDQNMESEIYEGKLWNVANLFTITNINTETSKTAHSGYHTQTQSAFASAQFGYKSMAYLDVTGRNDWSSTFAGSNTKSFFYPTVGISGILTDIFNISTDVMPYAKLRLSYSEVGNEPDPYLTIPTYKVVSGMAATTTNLPNSDLKPERTKSWEIGGNFTFFKNKLKLDVTAYMSRTYNQIFNPQLPSSSGYTSVYVNGGRVDNKGIELSLRYNQNLGKVNWETYLTYSLNRNKIKTLLDNWYCKETGEYYSMKEMTMCSSTAYKMILTEGGSIGDLYTSTLKTDEHGAIYVNPNSQTVETDPNKYVYAGNTSPKYNLSWGNTFSYKGLSLGFQLSARVGGIVLSETQAALDYFGASKATEDARNNGGAIVNGQLIPAKDYYQTIGGITGGVGSMYTYSATNVRLSELTLGYKVPIKKYVNWINELNLSFVGRNLFLLYCKAPFDPESTANTGTYYQGIDYFMMPSLRNLGFSVNVNF